MTLFYLVRHGETDWNRERRVQGSSDIPLNETGRRQASRAARLLARRSWDAIYSSPLSRAMETASIISHELALGEPVPLSGVIERDYGDAEGLTDTEISATWARRDRVPGQETRESVKERVLADLRRLATERPGGHFIVTTHGGVIRTMLIAVNADAHRSAPITNGSVHSFELLDGTLKLKMFDDPIDHASALPGDEDITAQNPVEAQQPAHNLKEKRR